MDSRRIARQLVRLAREIECSERVSMKLLTKQILNLLPPLYSQEDESDPMVYARFFNPYGAGTWLAIEYDGKNTFFGWAEITPGMGELGNFTLSELQSIGAERDKFFKPTPLSRAK